MKSLSCLALGCLLLGCFASGCAGQKYVEGTHLAIGAYVPGSEGELYGLELCQYLSGCMVRTSSNQTFAV